MIDWSSDVCSSGLAKLARQSHYFGWLQGDRRQRFPPTQPGRAGYLLQRHQIARILHRQPGLPRILVVDHSDRDGYARTLGRASCRARVGEYVSVSVGAVSLKQNITTFIAKS